MEFHQLVEISQNRKPFVDLLAKLTEEHGFVWPIRVYIEDTDAAGIVYHANHIKYLERARTELARNSAVAIDELQSQNKFLAVRAINIEYLSPAMLDQQILATAKIEKIGNTSLTFRQSLFAFKSVEEGAVLDDYEQSLITIASGTVTVVCISAASLRAVRIPEEIKERLEQHRK